ncbi:MAG TPA: sensor histidine kinase [Nocardioides sp.]|uniref:sensor histidine kinase n=1 Tax=Nocardioides sp. TaxID=35761 RepID=UPI002E339439|nr:sensor histidine kinase [Nocardioides sp.]HEX5087896.1 sensor histidine kinase [Nocardioides sp.]
MSRTGRWALVTAAWVGPLVWLALWASLTPSDGTVVTRPGAVLGEGRWEDSLLVLETHGGTPLHTGDRILAIEDTEMPRLVSEARLADASEGDVLRYLVLREGAELDVRQQVEVPITRYAVIDALLDDPHLLVAPLALLVAGTFLVVRRAQPVAAGATLLGGAAAGIALTAQPLGVQAYEAAGGGTLWPHLVGEAAVGVGLGALLVAAWAFPQPPDLLVGGRGWLLLAVPFAAWACWLVAYAARQPEPVRSQAALDLTLPAVAVAATLTVLAIASGGRRARSIDQHVALRLVMSALLTALVVILVLDLVPLALRGSPLVEREVLLVVLVPVVLACWVAAVVGYRIAELDDTLRRSLLQLVLVSLVGAVFLVAANAVNLAAGTSVRSMVTGGIVALALLPAVLLLRRAAARLLYGDRAFPYRVVSELRHLEPATGAEQLLDQVLSTLIRRLNLAYARIESAGGIDVARGERRGISTTVDLDVGGTLVGRLEMEVDPRRAPFGPRDRRLLEDVGTQVGALVQALDTGRELQRSREELVAAREEERRRLRRDLHDGLGPSLATTLMRLEVARELVDRDPAAARDLVERLVDQTEADIVEVRRLVDGLRPPALDQLGLVSALRQRADEHNHAAALGSGAPRWSVVSGEVGALPAAVEVAAYRIAVEAVNNATRHSGGTEVTVRLRRLPDALELTVRDDGAGLGEVTGSGVGVGSMRERAEEVGGSCTVASPPGGGTEVMARLPTSNQAGDREETR